MEKVIMQEKPNKSKKKRKVLMIVSVILAVILLAVIGIVIALKVTVFKEFPELKGEPETGNWYRITPEDAKSSDGSEWHGFFRKGSENKVWRWRLLYIHLSQSQRINQRQQKSMNLHTISRMVLRIPVCISSLEKIERY